jgi:hypothetical protein
MKQFARHLAQYTDYTLFKLCISYMARLEDTGVDGKTTVKCNFRKKDDWA